MLFLISLSGISSSDEYLHLSLVRGCYSCDGSSSAVFGAGVFGTGTGCFTLGSSVFRLCASILLCDGPVFGLNRFHSFVLCSGDMPRSSSK